MPTNAGRASPPIRRAGLRSSARPARRTEAENCSRRSRCSDSRPIQRAGLSSSAERADGAGQREPLCGRRPAQQLETPGQTPTRPGDPIEPTLTYPRMGSAAAPGARIVSLLSRFLERQPWSRTSLQGCMNPDADALSPLWGLAGARVLRWPGSAQPGERVFRSRTPHGRLRADRQGGRREHPESGQLRCAA
jgi:hypothetical protein